MRDTKKQGLPLIQRSVHEGVGTAILLTRNMGESNFLELHGEVMSFQKELCELSIFYFVAAAQLIDEKLTVKIAVESVAGVAARERKAENQRSVLRLVIRGNAYGAGVVRDLAPRRIEQKSTDRRRPGIAASPAIRI